MRNEVVQVLLVDDDEDDFVLTRDLLSETDATRFKLHWASTYESGREEVASGRYDVHLIDFRMGHRTGLELIREVIGNGARGPMILLTGQGAHEVDLEAMKSGAVDYLDKGRIDADLLERSIRYAIERKRVESERDAVIQELMEAMTQIKTLSGMLPICAACKKIRDDKGYWNFLESYIKDHSEAEFSHGICPECVVRLYPEHSDHAAGYINPAPEAKRRI